MILTDSHVHSDVSLDCHATMRQMAEAEAAAGVEKLCFTNHCDLQQARTPEFQPRCLETVPESAAKLDALRAEGGALPELALGIELGEPQFDPALSARLTASERLDFVLASQHNCPGRGDYYYLRYTDAAQCEALFDEYLGELEKIAALDCFDCMAHIGYCRRYMLRAGVDAGLRMERHGARLEALFRRLIDKGKGIEVNCSGANDGCGFFPAPEFLKLYRSLGGEIVTLGSDAHRPDTAAKGIREGQRLLRECGFDYVCFFRRRKPEFIKL